MDFDSDYYGRQRREDIAEEIKMARARVNLDYDRRPVPELPFTLRCINCKLSPAANGQVFCSEECRDEYKSENYD